VRLTLEQALLRVRQEADPKLAQELEEAKDQQELIRPLRDDVWIALQRTRLLTGALLLTELLRRLQAGTWRLIWLHPTRGALPFPEDLLAELTIDSFNTARSEVIFGGWRYHVRVEEISASNAVAAATPKKKPGRPPRWPDVRERMRPDLKQQPDGEWKLIDEKGHLIPRKNWQERYNAVPSTCDKALAELMSEIWKSTGANNG
jgi:hypothetical protein